MRPQRNATFAARPGTKRVVRKPPRQDGRPQHSDRFHGKQSLFTLPLSLWGSFSRFARLCLLKRDSLPEESADPKGRQIEGKAGGEDPLKPLGKSADQALPDMNCPFLSESLYFALSPPGGSVFVIGKPGFPFGSIAFCFITPQTFISAEKKSPSRLGKGTLGFSGLPVRADKRSSCKAAKKSGGRKSATARWPAGG